MTYIVMGYKVVAYTVMAHAVIAYTVMYRLWPNAHFCIVKA